jgi:coproporphyrinogen III oxidase
MTKGVIMSNQTPELNDLEMTLPQSTQAQTVLKALTSLQERFRDGLNDLSLHWGDQKQLARSSWLRDQGQHGGGWRWGSVDQGILNRGSLNISSVHYDDLPEKRLSSATALSCIVHPQNPVAPSLHTHISWTEMRNPKGENGQKIGGWRFMADLNPSTLFEEDRRFFIEQIDQSLESLPAEWLNYAKAQGDRYFWIPSLERHRGVAHYYLEQWQGESAEKDLELALTFGKTVIDSYLQILARAFEQKEKRAEASLENQIAYHSAYFLQVLTLDRGTSSGLLVHQQNDEGIMGSLPQRVSTKLLRSWVTGLPKPQDQLLEALIDCLPKSQSEEETVSEIDFKTRRSEKKTEQRKISKQITNPYI